MGQIYTKLSFSHVTRSDRSNTWQRHDGILSRHAATASDRFEPMFNPVLLGRISVSTKFVSVWYQLVFLLFIHLDFLSSLPKRNHPKWRQGLVGHVTVKDRWFRIWILLKA